MSLPARLTAPIARLDPVVNAVSDVTNRVIPWTWWPVEPPRADRPYSAAHHAAWIGWSVASFVASEVLVPARHKSTGTALHVERVASAASTVALGVVVAGAWDRRAAARRRRPWRLLGR